jgi:hypothetical protein
MSLFSSLQRPRFLEKGESIEILAYATIEALNRALGGKLKRNGGSEENTVVTRCCFRTHNGYCKALKT